jgi:hypothetical protein
VLRKKSKENWKTWEESVGDSLAGGADQKAFGFLSVHYSEGQLLVSHVAQETGEGSLELPRQVVGVR